jgi:hypothetical protein
MLEVLVMMVLLARRARAGESDGRLQLAAARRLQLAFLKLFFDNFSTF